MTKQQYPPSRKRIDLRLRQMVHGPVDRPALLEPAARMMFVFGEGTQRVGRGPAENPEGRSPYGMNRARRRA